MFPLSLIPPTITQSLFSRGNGFWTHPRQEYTTDFFYKLTDVNSQREDWYVVTPYIAEFWCAISNITIIYAGVRNKSPELVFAGCASVVSHSIPLQWLLYVDKFGVLLVVMQVLRYYREVMKKLKLIWLLPLAGFFNLLDSQLARRKGLTMPHVLWHCASAIIADYFLRAVSVSKCRN